MEERIKYESTVFDNDISFTFLIALIAAFKLEYLENCNEITQTNCMSGIS